MKKYIIVAAALVMAALSVNAKKYENVDTKYCRSSIYSVLLNHTEQKFGKEIKEQFLNIPTPDQYYNHDLNVKVINVSNNSDQFLDSIKTFIEANKIASRMVAKWFDRNQLTGECSMDMVKERGIYNASELDKELAARSPRGVAMLADAGEQLIGKSFLLVNEIKYGDKAKTSAAIGTGLKIFGAIAGSFIPGMSALGDIMDNVGDMVSTIKGFKVKIKTHLFQLKWNDDIATIFYRDCYASEPDPDKRKAFEDMRGQFELEYVGCVESSGSTTSFMGINEEEPLLMVRKACQRAIDDNVADLQTKYDQFRVSAPVVESDGKIVMAQIGMKEGVKADNKYEVLEAEEKDGRIIYKRVAVVKAVANKIWDNRFMAAEEMAYGADFGATTFEKISGGDVMKGHLLRRTE